MPKINRIEELYNQVFTKNHTLTVQELLEVKRYLFEYFRPNRPASNKITRLVYKQLLKEAMGEAPMDVGMYLTSAPDQIICDEVALREDLHALIMAYREKIRRERNPEITSDFKRWVLGICPLNSEAQAEEALRKLYIYTQAWSGRYIKKYKEVPSP